MHHQAFVSYSNKDEGLVRQHLQLLRARGIACWFAPERVPGGEDFAKLVEQAIAQSTIVLLIATRNAIDSREVMRELVLADDRKVPVVPLLLDPDLTLDKGFGYRLAGRQNPRRWCLGRRGGRRTCIPQSHCGPDRAGNEHVARPTRRADRLGTDPVSR